MKKDYWDVTDSQVLEKTGKPVGYWMQVLAEFNSSEKKSTEVVAMLQEKHQVPRYWARTLTTMFLKQTES